MTVPSAFRVAVKVNAGKLGGLPPKPSSVVPCAGFDVVVVFDSDLSLPDVVGAFVDVDAAAVVTVVVSPGFSSVPSSLAPNVRLHDPSATATATTMPTDRTFEDVRIATVWRADAGILRSFRLGRCSWRRYSRATFPPGNPGSRQ